MAGFASSEVYGRWVEGLGPFKALIGGSGEAVQEGNEAAGVGFEILLKGGIIEIEEELRPASPF